MILLLCAGWSAGMSAQKNAHYVAIDPPFTLPNFGMRIEAVEDVRPNQESIGFAQRGLANRSVPARFKRPVANTLQTYFDKLIDPAPDAAVIIVRVHELAVSEYTSATKETARCVVRLEFLRPQNDQLRTLGIFESIVENGGMDVSSGHGRRINKALYDCLSQVANTDWRNVAAAPEAYPVATAPVATIEKWTAGTQPERGIYVTTVDLINQRPDTEREFQMEMLGATNRYRIRDERNKRIKRVAAFSDGEHLYIHATNYNVGNYFVRALFQGHYIYLEDRYSDPMAGAAFGAIGAIASTKTRSILIDTATGQTIVLNKQRMRDLLTNHPDLLAEYEAGQKQVPEQRELVVKLNTLLAAEAG